MFIVRRMSPMFQPVSGAGGLVVLLLAERAPSEGPRSTRAFEDQPGRHFKEQQASLEGALTSD
jgi:hypothetical protein